MKIQFQRSKKLPQKPTNLSEYNCDIKIWKQHFTKLEISPDYQEKNKEFQLGLKRKGIKLTKTELFKVLINDDLIQELIKQVAKKEKRIKWEGQYYQYDYYTYEPVFNQWGYAFRLVWCIDKNNPHILGVIDCYWRDKYNKTTWPWH